MGNANLKADLERVNKWRVWCKLMTCSKQDFICRRQSKERISYYSVKGLTPLPQANIIYCAFISFIINTFISITLRVIYINANFKDI